MSVDASTWANKVYSTQRIEEENTALRLENLRLQEAIRSSWNGVIITFLAGFIVGAFIVLALYNP